MIFLKKITICLCLLITVTSFGQLGFCSGSKGDPIFSENFGNGTNYGPALPTGTTNYTFVIGNPNDGSYTLFYRTNLYNTWHYALDHTPDVTNGTNGKALIVNANANTSGEFYKRTVTGLCVNTRFEFSAWLLNVYNPSSGFCGASEIPINVRFEIWNDTETTLLGSGNTGNIMGTSTPNWQQFALVFTTTNQTSVVLKMKNNGLGGCGNDLAIDDIEFRSCGDLTTISSSLTPTSNYSSCGNVASLTLQAATSGVSTYFYQWQSSSNGLNWTDILGATAATFTAVNTNVTTYFRTKVAQDASNLNNNFCSTLSNVFSVTIDAPNSSPVSLGDKVVCGAGTLPSLAVTAGTGTTVNWYDAAIGGNLLQSNATTYTPSGPGTFYAEASTSSATCVSVRTPVTLTVNAPTASISGNTTICNGSTATLTVTGTANATVSYSTNGSGSQDLLLDATGSASFVSGALSLNTTYSLLSSTLNGCSLLLNSTVQIIVNPSPTATLAIANPPCVGTSTAILFTGTPNASVVYTVDNGPHLTLQLDASGLASISSTVLFNNMVVTLVSCTSTGSSSCTQLLQQQLTVVPTPLPTAQISASQTSVCNNQTAALTITGTPNSMVTYTVGSQSQTATIDGTGSISFSSLPLTGTTVFQLQNSSLLGPLACSHSLNSSLQVTIRPTPTASFTGNLVYCATSSTAITLHATLAGTVFSWTATPNNVTGASADSGSFINQSLDTNGAFDGTVTYTVTPTFNGCSGAVLPIVVQVNALPLPQLSDGVICLNTAALPYSLTTNLSGSAFSFAWYLNGALLPNASTNSYAAFQIGTYEVVATSLSTGCVSAPDVAQVTQTAQGTGLSILQSEMFSSDPVVTVTVIGGSGPFLYQLDDVAFQTSNVFYDVAMGTHALTVIDGASCTDLTASFTVVAYPKYFTPNNDGINDTWNIKDVGATAAISIFDRYGKLIKQISPLGTGWDGTYNGRELPSDDYWFSIDFIEKGIARTFKAHFALKR